MERDWAADEAAVDRLTVLQAEKLIMDLFAERRRLAELLTWRPGPPTEPGLYVCEYSDDKPFYLVERWPLDYGDIPVLHVAVARHVPLPQPPSEEAANG